MGNLLEAREWDYVVGSVHFVRDHAVDMPGDWDVWRTTFESPEKVWRRYFETLGECARSGLYDILAHPDLVKVWGRDRPRPEGDLRRYYELALEGIVESGIAIEVSTAGLRKPVGERYPAEAFLEMLLEAGCPVALSSDAHLPEHVGWDYEQTVEWLAGFGVTELAVFEKRQRRMEPIGAS
jgi:histidinol-phosphatase (PHP family)